MAVDAGGDLRALPGGVGTVTQLDDVVSHGGHSGAAVAVRLAEDDVIVSHGRDQTPVVFGVGGGKVEALAASLVSYDELVGDLSVALRGG